MEKLCDVLRRTGVKELKCSIRLGVARFELEGRSVMLYQSGRVDIRRIQNTGEAGRIGTDNISCEGRLQRYIFLENSPMVLLVLDIGIHLFIKMLFNTFDVYPD